MIKITHTKDSNLRRDYDAKWRESHDAKIGLSGKASDDKLSDVPQSDVDAIAAMMDGDIKHETTSEPQRPLLSPKEQDIARMMQNYIQQNGGVVQQENPNIKKNQTLLG